MMVPKRHLPSPQQDTKVPKIKYSVPASGRLLGWRWSSFLPSCQFVDVADAQGERMAGWSGPPLLNPCELEGCFYCQAVEELL